MAPPRVFPLWLSPPTTSQLVSPIAQCWEVTGACVLRLSCDGNRSTPLRGESERVLAHVGHATNVTPLSRKRVASMGTTPANVHLVDLAGGFWSPTAGSWCVEGAGATVSVHSVIAAVRCSGRAPGAETRDPIALPGVTVPGLTPQGYVVPDAVVGTKTDTPILRLPFSVEVVPRAVISDQGATQLKTVNPSRVMRRGPM